MEFPEEFNFTFLEKHYLQIEVERLEIALKHFFNAGWINMEDYQFLVTNLKMLRAFLNTRIHPIKTKPETLNIIGSQNQDIQYGHKKPYEHPKIQLSLFDIQKPLPITGEVIVSGLNESLKALRPKSPEYTGPKFPYRIPAGTCWNNVIIKFLNDEQVEIWVKKVKHITDFKEMGMVGKGNIPRPCEQWLFLKILAQCNGELTIKDPEAKDTYKKQKQALSETLKRYFSIDYDPFYPYQSCMEKSGNSYKIKLLLIPPPEKVNEQRMELDNDADTLGIHEFLQETAPQVIDS